MKMPGFSADASLYVTANQYRAGPHRTPQAGSIQPALTGNQCHKYCCGPSGCDDGCLDCCICIARGGKPQHCCQ